MPSIVNSARPAALLGAQVQSPADLNDRRFFDRFVADLAGMAANLPRALLTIAGAPLSDTVGRLGRAAIPGGSTGFDYGVQTWDSVVKPIGQSLLNTVDLAGDLAYVPNVLMGGTERANEHLDARKDEFVEHPGEFLVEHVGNAALAGALVAKPLGMAGATRAADIAGNIVAHPYRQAGSKLADMHLPTRSGGRTASLREVGAQLAESNPRMVDGVPTPVEDLTSPLAQRLRTAANSDQGQQIGDFFSRPVREVRGMIQSLNEQVTDHSMDTLVERTPAARKTQAVRQIRALAKDAPDVFRDAGVSLPRRRLKDGDLLGVLEKVRDTPALRAKLPRLQKTLDLSILDAYERVNGLTDGALRNQLLDDLTLTPAVAGKLRTTQRGLDQLDPDARAKVEEALGQAYRIPEEQLAVKVEDLPPSIRASYEGAREQLTLEAAERDATMAERGLSDPEKWGARVEDLGDGTFRPLRPDEAPELTVSPSAAQAKTLRNQGKRIQALRKTADVLLTKAERLHTGDKATVAKDFTTLKRQIIGLARSLDSSKAPAETAGAVLDNLNAVANDIAGRLQAAGINASNDVATRLEALQIAANLGQKGDATAAARVMSGTGHGFEDRLLRDQTKAQAAVAQTEAAVNQMLAAEEKFTQLEADMLASLEAAPGVARPFLQVARDVGPKLDAIYREVDPALADDLAFNDLPKLLEDMNAEGVSPVFLSRLENREGATGHRAAAEEALKTPKLRSQRRRTMTDMDLQRGLDRVKAEQDIPLVSSILAHDTAALVQEKFGRSMDALGDRLIESGKVNRDDWADMAKHQREKLLQENGYVVYAPTEIFSFKVRRTNPETSVWIPSYLQEALTRYRKDRMIDKLIKRGLQPGTTAWKTYILALRPAWHVYNIVGGAAMATVAGRVAAHDYLKFIRGEAGQLLRQHKLGWDLEGKYGLTADMADDLLEGGLSRDLAPRQSQRSSVAGGLIEGESLKRLLDSKAGLAGGRVSRKATAVIQGSYRVNALFDNLNRATVYLDQTINKGAAPETALAHAQQVMGDYKSMTPTEKIYIRSVFPFYAWMRHITTLTGTMLKPENVTRAAIFGTVTQTLGEPNGQEEFFPEYMAGDVLFPDTDLALGMRGFNPWQDVFDPFVYNEQLSLRGMARSMHPLAQLGLERSTGIDTLTGRPFSRPVPVVDDLGREIPTPPPLGTHLFNKLAPPQLDLARNLFYKATGQTTARYSTGDPVLVEGVREPNALAGLGSFFGVPVRAPDIEGIEDRRQAAMDRVGRAIERYNAELEAYQQGQR